MIGEFFYESPDDGAAGRAYPKEDESYNHTARTCRVGPDNKLYITLGQRLWRDQGKVQQARELLAPVYGWFTEGSTRAI